MTIFGLKKTVQRGEINKRRVHYNTSCCLAKRVEEFFFKFLVIFYVNQPSPYDMHTKLKGNK